MTSPSTPPPAATPAHVPTALPRSSGGNTVVITDSVTGMTNAAPTPIRMRSADQLGRRVREQRHEGRAAEQGEPEGQHRLAADAVADRAGRQEQRRERQRVRVDDPLQLRLGGADVPRDRGQRDVQAGDGGDHHHQREAHDPEDRPAPRSFVHRRVLRSIAMPPSRYSTLVEFNECRLLLCRCQRTSGGRSGRRRGTHADARGDRGRGADPVRRARYDRATFRSIARAAGVDPALVVHFFGSKDELFREVMKLPPAWPAPWRRLAQVPAGRGRPAAGRGDRRRVREPGDAADHRRPDPLRQPASGGGRTRASGRRRRSRAAHVRRSTSTSPTSRAVLFGVQVVGIALARYVVRVEPLASMPPSRVVELLAPTFQRCLVEPLT